MPGPVSIQEAASKNYVDNKFNDPSVLKNSKPVDLSDRKITNARFIQVNQFPQIDSHLTAKLYVDNALSDAKDEPSLLRLDPDEKLKRSYILFHSTLTTPKLKLELPNKYYVGIKFNDRSIIKTPLMLTSTIKISMTLDSLK